MKYISRERIVNRIVSPHKERLPPGRPLPENHPRIYGVTRDGIHQPEQSNGRIGSLSFAAGSDFDRPAQKKARPVWGGHSHFAGEAAVTGYRTAHRRI